MDKLNKQDMQEEYSEHNGDEHNKHNSDSDSDRAQMTPDTSIGP